MPTSAPSRLQLCILLACAKYRFLTNAQLHLLQLGHPVTLRRATRALSRNPSRLPYLRCHRFAISPRHGRLANLFTVTESGLAVLREAFPQRSFPTTPPSIAISLDYHHRVACISFRILFDLALQDTPYRVESSRWYFEKRGANRRRSGGDPLISATRFDFADGSHFIPDGVIVLRHVPTGKRTVFAVECVNGRDSARTVRQVGRHQLAIVERVVSDRFHLPPQQSFVSLFFFLKSAHVPRVLERLEKTISFTPFRPNFLFTTFEEFGRNPFVGWRSVGSPDVLFNCITGEPDSSIPE